MRVKILFLAANPVDAGTQNKDASAEDQKKKKGFLGKITSIFRDDKTANPPSQPPADNGNSPR